VKSLHGQTITVTYQDANDGTGNPASPNDTAMVDCVAPNIISDVNVDVMGPDVTVTFETDEYTLGRVLYGLSCGGPYNSDVDLEINHSIKLTEISPWTDYFFIVEATDPAGNKIVDNNDGNCYQFSTDGPNDFNVPGDFNSIQDAIDHSWDGGTVTVAPGTYNESIFFRGRAITVKSTDPNDWDVVENTIVDSNSLCSAFYFSAGEDANSVISGFTVKGQGRVIFVQYSDPTISNCVIEGPYGSNDYMDTYSIKCWWGSPIILNNIIRGNYGIFKTADGKIVSAGGGIYCLDNAAVIRNNLIYANAKGISIVSDRCLNTSTITNNTIVYNMTHGITNARVSGRAPDADVSEVTINNCVFWGNDGNDLFSFVGPGNVSDWPLSVTYSCIEDGFDPNDPNYAGSIDSDPCFINVCDFIDSTEANGTTTTIIVADANLYEVNDVIEYNNDGIIRTVTDANLPNSTITFDNSLDADSTFGVLIFNWGPGITDVNEDFHLLPNSPCIDKGNPNGS